MSPAPPTSSSTPASSAPILLWVIAALLALLVLCAGGCVTLRGLPCSLPALSPPPRLPVAQRDARDFARLATERMRLLLEDDRAVRAAYALAAVRCSAGESPQ